MNKKNSKGNAVRITANLKKEWTNLVSNTTKAEAQVQAIGKKIQKLMGDPIEQDKKIAEFYWGDKGIINFWKKHKSGSIFKHKEVEVQKVQGDDSVPKKTKKVCFTKQDDFLVWLSAQTGVSKSKVYYLESLVKYADKVQEYEQEMESSEKQPNGKHFDKWVRGKDETKKEFYPRIVVTANRKKPHVQGCTQEEAIKMLREALHALGGGTKPKTMAERRNGKQAVGTLNAEIKKLQAENVKLETKLAKIEKAFA